MEKGKKIAKMVYDKSKILVNHLGKISIIFIAMLIGFFLSEFNHNVKNKRVAEISDFKSVHLIKTTSVAVNERGELLIIDRNTNKCQVYEDSIGRAIFRLYASQMISNVNK